MKKILIISPVPTHPPFAGNRSAILSYAELLQHNNFKVSFLFVQSQNNESEKEQTEKYWGDSFFYYKTNKLFYRKQVFYRWKFKNIKNSYNVDNWFPNGLGQFVRKIHRKKNFDIVIVNYIWLTKIFLHLSEVKKILFTHDVFSNRYQRTGVRWFSVTPEEERKALNRSDIVLSIQEEESKFFRKLTSKKVITTFSPTIFNKTVICNNKNLLFFAGPNDYNVNGLVQFISSTLPLLQTEIEGLKLIVGGRICNRKEILDLESEIILYGEVDEPEKFYQIGDIVVNPVFEGTGLKIKNIEALSFEKIVICHPHNAEGIYDKENAPIILATNSSEYLSILKHLFASMENLSKKKMEVRKYISEFNKVVNSRFLEALN